MSSGCFWCVESIYESLVGVDKVESGYSGGYTKNPTYDEVCSGLTGHTEVVRVVYDPKKLNLKKIKFVFFSVFLFLIFLSPILYSYVSISQSDKRTDYPGKRNCNENSICLGSRF